jgi:CubicO group peptidase (beta-lactamase class C family)
MFIDAKYQSVADLFFAQAKLAPVGGSALAIYKDGQLVLDVWQGQATPGHQWNDKTTSVIFSNTKGLISILAHQLIDSGLLDVGQRVAHYWPSFAQNGKSEIPVKWVLQHKAGLSAVRRDLTFEELIDGHTVIEEIEKQEPLWTPGSGHAYHAITFGHLLSKLFQSVTGKTAGQLLQEQVAQPLGVHAYIGLPDSEFANLAQLETDGNRHSQNAPKYSPQYWVEKSMTFGTALPIEIASPGAGFNDPRLLRTELAGAGGVMSAKSLAKIYSATVVPTDGVRLLTDEAIHRAIVPAVTGASVWGEPGPWPVRGSGFMLNVPEYREMLSETSFGHDGLGGQQGFADLENRIGFGYIASYLYSGEAEQSNQQALIQELKKVL